MCTLSNINEFKLRASGVHSNLYNYNKFIYVNARTKGIIICKIHKDFLQSPDTHINKKTGCPKCGVISTANQRRNTREKFIEKANNLYLGIYSYEKFVYLGCSTKSIITCKIHGDFRSSLFLHVMKKQGCKECAKNLRVNKRRLTNEDFLKKAKKVHADKYTYNDLSYKNCNNKIVIYCNTCQKDFKQVIDSHLNRKAGCPFCFREKLTNLHRDTTRNLENQFTYLVWKQNGIKSKLFDSFKVYIIKCWNDKENFYKIGKTFLKIKGRYGKTKIPYNWEIIKVFEGEAIEMSKLEHRLQRENKEFRYVPNIAFGGRYECFSQLIQI